ncbi:MAG: hypothetical protein CMN78_04670 [Spirochaetales bacterium]|nr:hypothetical protein [Spirochaetales bacterium]
MVDFSHCALLLEAMNREYTLLGQFKSAETELAGAIRAKNMSQLESCTQEMAALSDELAEVEKQRHLAFFRLRAAAGEDQDASFYQVIAHLPVDARDLLAELYRSLKFAVIGVQAVTSSLDEHINTVHETMQKILNELFPHRKGNMYSRAGKRREVDSNPLVVNQHL